MDSATQWLWRVTGRKKGFVLALTLVQAVSGGLGVLYALLLRNIVDSAVGRDSGAFWHNIVLIVTLVVLQISLSAVVRWLQELAKSDIEDRFKQRLTDMAVVIITHRKAALRICDRVMQLTEAGIEDVTVQNG